MNMVTLVALAQSWSITVAMVSLCVGAIVGASGFSRRDVAAFTAGGITGALGLVFFASMAVRVVCGSPWISLAVVGVLFILSAAWLEKNKSKLELWRRACVLRFKQVDRVQTMDRV